MLTEVKKHLTPKQIRDDIVFFALLNLGLVATAAGIALFKTPNHFAFGGTSGCPSCWQRCFHDLT